MSEWTPDPVTGRLMPGVQEAAIRVESPHASTVRFSIYANDGALLFAMYGDGSVTCPDETRIPEAARMFWREVKRLTTERPQPVDPDPILGQTPSTLARPDDPGGTRS